MTRVCLSGEMYLDAVVIDPLHQLRAWFEALQSERRERESVSRHRLALPPSNVLGRRAVPGEISATAHGLLDVTAAAVSTLVPSSPKAPMAIDEPNEDLVTAIRRRKPFIALRWVLNPSLGIPLEPFTVWRRSIKYREQPRHLRWRRASDGSIQWDEITEMMIVEVDVTASTSVTILGHSHHQTTGAVASASAPPGTSTVRLEGGGPMLGLQVLGSASVHDIRGVSVVEMANGTGWEPIERVGLPLDPGDMAVIYYQGQEQGPVSMPTDPRSAAVQRMELWGPVLGWMSLVGLPPWVAPDPKPYLDELDDGLLPALLKMLSALPPLQLDEQQHYEVQASLGTLIRNTLSTGLNTGQPGYESTARVKPLTILASGVSSDPWASLALGFGTGAEITDRDGDETFEDFMVTAPWQGMLVTRGDVPGAFPGLPGAPVVEIKVQMDRELAAVVLAPRPRPAPGSPSPVTATLAYLEGADQIDGPYHAAVTLTSPRPQVMPGYARVSGYALARFSPSGGFGYVMREHPHAQGWIPIAPAGPARVDGQPAPPVAPVTLRDSGLDLPLKPPAVTYGYACAAGDLFGQWGPWSTTSLVAAPAEIAGPAVAAVRAVATPGATGGDPCVLEVAADLSWDWTERSLHHLEVHIDVLDTPPPPAAIPTPAGSPTTAGAATALIFVTSTGTASTATSGVTIQALSEDATTLYLPGQPDPTPTAVRRFRLVYQGIPVTYGGVPEKAVVVYARASDGVRTSEMGPWVGAREAVIAPNPIPPVTPELPLETPEWASLPDAAGVSRVSLTWTHTGAWGYRLYEATEAALRAVCGQPGPVLTERLSSRLQTLFDLYHTASNLDRLKSCYRKVNEDPICPAGGTGSPVTYEVELPRGSSLIHCFVMVGVTPSNVVSAWPQPDANGRKAFLPYVIPQLRRPLAPEVVARRTADGTVAVSISCTGPVPATGLRVYRAADARLARHTGTMQHVATAPEPPATHPDWTLVTTGAAITSALFTDTSAARGWDNVHYRVVAVTSDDPEHAAMAAASPASKPSAVLVPPAAPPTLAVTPNVTGTTLTAGVIRVLTNAPAQTNDAGNHVITTASIPAGASAISPPPEPVRHTSPLPTLARYAGLAAFLAGGDDVAVVDDGTTPPPVLMRLHRKAGEDHSLIVIMADPLGRTARWTGTVPGAVPDPLPVLGNLQLQRALSVISASWDGNTPDPWDPARPWKVTVAVEPIWWWLNAPQAATFDVPDVPVVSGPQAMPTPSANPAMKFAIAQVDGTTPRRFLFWIRSKMRMQVEIRLGNPDGVWTTISGVTP